MPALEDIAEIAAEDLGDVGDDAVADEEIEPDEEIGEDADVPTEREEESLIEQQVAAVGMPVIERRHDADPRAVLGLADLLPSRADLDERFNRRALIEANEAAI